MRSLLLVFVVLVLLSYVPPVRSGLGAYLRKVLVSCWLTKGLCKRSCGAREEFHIFCDHARLCCINKKDLPLLGAQ
uniref:Beta-defensin n=1 Tax=Rousettus aegyptiacus TaxID=9407 RepID=A0A7J8BPY8_ROUAE|nr:defensin beta 135 [Rousettus aegyptiacus]